MIITPPPVIRLTQFTAGDMDEITGGVADPFEVGETGLSWLPKSVHFGVRQSGRLVAHAGLVDTEVAVGEVRLRVGGLGSVIVAPDLRGQGLARTVVAAAVGHARGEGAEFGLLFCLPDRAPLYRRLGWRIVEDEVRVEQPGGPVLMPLRTMWIPLAEDAGWPAGPVRLLSLPM